MSPGAARVEVEKEEEEGVVGRFGRQLGDAARGAAENLRLFGRGAARSALGFVGMADDSEGGAEAELPGEEQENDDLVDGEEELDDDFVELDELDEELQEEDYDLDEEFDEDLEEEADFEDEMDDEDEFLVEREAAEDDVMDIIDFTFDASSDAIAESYDDDLGSDDVVDIVEEDADDLAVASAAVDEGEIAVTLPQALLAEPATAEASARVAASVAEHPVPLRGVSDIAPVVGLNASAEKVEVPDEDASGPPARAEAGAAMSARPVVEAEAEEKVQQLGARTLQEEEPEVPRGASSPPPKVADSKLRRSMATVHADVAEAQAPAAKVLPAAPSAPLLPWMAPGDARREGPPDLYLFIKDYAWSLRYRVARGSDDDSLDTEKPLDLEWIKLRRPLRRPAELLDASARELFDWAVRAPPRHKGFMYSVTEAVGSGVEAVINFFRGRGPTLLIRPTGISLAAAPGDADLAASPGALSSGGVGGVDDDGEGDDGEADDEPPGTAVTHCWVEVAGLPFFPMLRSIAFFNAQDVVVDWRA